MVIHDVLLALVRCELKAQYSGCGSDLRLSRFQFSLEKGELAVSVKGSLPVVVLAIALLAAWAR
jgi:hypothetical protein